ncbi:MAG TPA: type II secretion system minor pseudopilin GspK [Desulfatiglandales bacterium]|nr:type II secretion system minor pseudopilin GspK [Desulfatiglandales bacterium]
MVIFRPDNRGMALILTILVVALIVVLTLEFNTSMRSDLFAAVNLSDGIKLTCIAKSGFHGARAVLHADRIEGNVDTHREVWAQSGLLSENAAVLFDEGKVYVEITDLSGRIQINQLIEKDGTYNALQKDLLLRFLNLPEFGLDSQEAENIVDALKDWMDTDNEVTGFGAEDSYYQTLERPYPCKNGPLEFPEELQFVRGITKELLYGSAENPGILSYVSVHGDGKININTAGSLALRALSEQIDEDMVDALNEYRINEDNDLASSTWYKKAAGMADVNIPDALLTTSSTYFEIISRGLKGTMSKQIRGVVERDDITVKVLSMKIE